MMLTREMRTAGRMLGAMALLVGLGAGPMRAQTRGTKLIALSPPNVKVFATPLTVTVAWRAVDGAASYTVERASSPNGPWSLLPLDPRAGTQVTAPTTGGTWWNGGGGVLYYYRVTALPSLGEPGVTVVPRVTPQLDFPLGVEARQEGADLRVSWAPVPFATGYVVTAAPGQQLPPTHTVEVGAQYAEAQLINVVPPSMPVTVWVAVSARYGPAGALSNAVPRQFGFPAVQTCWPSSSVPGPAPVVSLTTLGLTAVSVTTALTGPQLAVIRVERVPMGSPIWRSVGCIANSGTVVDASLTTGTQYQYRVTEITPSGTVGQAIVGVETRPAPDNPLPRATLSDCTGEGCRVTLNWRHVAGAEDYRIESSYGLYRAYTGLLTGGSGTPTETPISVLISRVPRGVHSFSLTALFPSMRPSPQAPGQVTVVVP